MIFAEPLYSLEDYRAFTRAVPIPVLANITEFGKRPLFTIGELRGVGVVLYSLSAFRAMSAAAVRVRETIWKTRTQKGVVDQMQTREQLNDHCFEDKLDQLFTKNQKV